MHWTQILSNFTPTHIKTSVSNFFIRFQKQNSKKIKIKFVRSKVQPPNRWKTLKWRLTQNSDAFCPRDTKFGFFSTNYILLCTKLNNRLDNKFYASLPALWIGKMFQDNFRHEAPKNIFQVNIRRETFFNLDIWSKTSWKI